MADFIKYDENSSLDEKLRLLEHNARSLTDLQKEINNPSLGVVIKTGVMPDEEDLKDFDIPESETKKVDSDFLAFYESITNIKVDENFSDNVFMLMPSSDYHFKSYIAMAKIKVYESIVLLSNMAFEDASCAKGVLEYVHEMQRLFVALDELMEEETLLEESTKALNDLYFLQSGNTFDFVTSIDKDITIDFYDRIYSILESLRNGYIKNFKYLGDKKFFEIRSDIVRVFFAKIGPNKFLVLDVILKKKKSSIEYWDRMNSLKDALSLVKEDYQIISLDPEATQKHFELYESIIAQLKGKNRG